MTPISYFEDAWQRCNEITTLQKYLKSSVTSVLSVDELLRAEWVSRVSSLDLYVHEVVAQNMVEIFEGRRQMCRGYSKFMCSTETLLRVKNAKNGAEATAAFELELKSKLGRLTYQYPDDIADGIRMISDCELWNELALKNGATNTTKISESKALKKDLSLIVNRRNKIAHEGDMQPTAPRTPWPINKNDVKYASSVIEKIVYGIDSII